MMNMKGLILRIDRDRKKLSICIRHQKTKTIQLGNIFLDGKMKVKIGDFGLATEIKFDGERKRTLCGTPNYIAPEILTKQGHSHEVDIWSTGEFLKISKIF